MREKQAENLAQPLRLHFLSFFPVTLHSNDLDLDLFLFTSLVCVFLNLYFKNMSFLGRGQPQPQGGINPERIEMATAEYVGSVFCAAV